MNEPVNISCNDAWESVVLNIDLYEDKPHKIHGEQLACLMANLKALAVYYHKLD